MRKAGSQGRQRLLQVAFLKLPVVLFLVSMAAVASAQTLEIVLINGKNGRPMVGESSHMNVWVGTERKNPIIVDTDKKGTATIQLTQDPNAESLPKPTKIGAFITNHPIVKYDALLKINVPYVVCAPGGANYSWLGIMHFSTSEILQHGYASPNTCGKVSIVPKPGQVILFVRHLPWWEAFKS